MDKRTFGRLKAGATRQLLTLINFWVDEFEEEPNEPDAMAACVATFENCMGIDDPVAFCQFLQEEGAEGIAEPANQNSKPPIRIKITAPKR